MVKDLPSLIFVGGKETVLPKYPPGLDTVIVEASELTIGVDMIRDLKKQLAIQSVKNQPKTALIPEAEKLTPQAQNALLKTLEEPPANTTIILVTPSIDKLLPTVISRCQIVFLPTKTPVLSPKEEALAKKLLTLIQKGDVAAGFSAVSKVTDRKEALALIDKLLVATHQTLDPKTFQKLTQAKKYLQASTNVRLTLENLFLD